MIRQILVLPALLLISFVVEAQQSATIRLETDAETITVGDVFTVSVSIDSDEFINLGDVILEFDPQTLRVESVEGDDSRFTFAAIDEVVPARGSVRIVRGEPHPTAPRGANLPFCSVSFRVIAAARSATISVAFDGSGAEGDSAVYKDDGVPTDILQAVIPAKVNIQLPPPRVPSGRVPNSNGAKKSARRDPQPPHLHHQSIP